MNSTSVQQTTDQYNVSSTSGFTEILLVSDFVSYNGSTTYSDYNETSIIVLLSTTSSSFVSWSNVQGGSGSSELITGITVSCITCVIILLIIIALVVWRSRAIPQRNASYAADRLEAHKYGAISAFALCMLRC